MKLRSRSLPGRGRVVLLCAAGLYTPAAQAAAPVEITTSISAIHNMPLNSAAKKLAVRAEGVVTDIGGWPYGITVQDGSDGIYVGLAPGAARAAVGQRIVVHGTTDPGQFATIIIAGRIDVKGIGPLPRPYLPEAREIASGELDNRRVEVRGVVRAVAKGEMGDGTATYMAVDMNPGTVHVAVARGIKIDLSTFVDATIRASGVVGVEYNSRRQALGGRVTVDRIEDIAVVRPPSAAALSGPPTPVASIFTWGAKHDWSHRIKVNGVLTFQRPGEYLILQDRDQAIRVDSPDTAPLALGSSCDAAGFAIPASSGPMLADAVAQCFGSPKPQKAIFREASKVTPGDDNWLLIKIRGRLLGMHESGSGISLSLDDHGVRFTADAPGSAARDLEAITPGSQLELTGINEVLVDALHRSIGFRLSIRSPKDIVVLSAGPWLNAGRILWSALALAIVAFFCATWALMLRSRVRSQTSWISESLRREKAEAWLHSERGKILGLIGRNAPLQQICEGLVGVIESGWPTSKAAIGIQLGDKWDWVGSIPEESGLRTESFDIESSSGSLRAKVVLSMDEADTGGELTDMFRECISIALEHRDLHERLVRQSLSDPLTQLPNRRSLDGHLDLVLADAPAKRHRPAVLVMDMDGFKAINDTLGHHVGDIVLQRLAQRFTSIIRNGDLIARIGGDEFVAVLENVTGLREAQEVAARLAEQASWPIDVSGIEIKPSLSIGIALFPADGNSAQALKNTADTRMYESKARKGEEMRKAEGSLQREPSLQA